MESKIDSFKKHILEDKLGESVRDSIIDAVNAVGKQSTNAITLNGVTFDKFATLEEHNIWLPKLQMHTKFDEITDIDEETEDSKAIISMHPMTSGNIFEYVKRYLRPSLKACLKYQDDPESESLPKDAIENYFKSLEKAKNDIKKSIRAKGQKPKDAKSFIDFTEMINNIGMDNPELVEDASFTKEGEQDAGETAGGRNKAYSKAFTVNVTDKFETKSIGSSENNTTVYAPEGKLYSKVSVNISGSGGRSGLGSGRTGGSATLDENGMSTAKMFTENGTFLAEDDGVNGWGSISVHVKLPSIGSNVSFKVTFKDSDGNVLGDPVMVPPYGVARYPGDPPTPPSESMVFAGWEPAPCNVINDMEVVAKFKTKTQGDSGEIEEDWPTIIAERGAQDKWLGKSKALELGEINGHNYGTIIFQKVADGEDGTTSSWVSQTVIESFDGWSSNWPICPFRNFLETTFIEDLMTTEIGELLAKNVLPVRKKSICRWLDGLTLDANMYVESTTIDRFWVPSAAELFGEVPEDIYNEIMTYHYNGYDKEKNEFVRLQPSNDSFNSGTIAGPDPNHRFETWYTNYAIVNEGCTFSIHHHDPLDPNHRYDDFQLVANNVAKYKRKSSTSDNFVEYFTRTADRDASAGNRTCMWNVNAAGTISYGNWFSSNVSVPIGFCL